MTEENNINSDNGNIANIQTMSDAERCKVLDDIVAKISSVANKIYANEDERINKSCQAEPIFYGIIDVEQEICPEGYEDGYAYYDSDRAESYSLEDIVFEEKEFEDRLEESGYEFDDVFKTQRDDDGKLLSIEYVSDEYALEKIGLEKVCYRNKEFLCHDLFFLTRESADNYLSNNRHHHSHDAYSYAMTAFRNPEYEELWTALRDLGAMRASAK